MGTLPPSFYVAMGTGHHLRLLSLLALMAVKPSLGLRLGPTLHGEVLVEVVIHQPQPGDLIIFDIWNLQATSMSPLRG